jgi:hypothetical protein
MKIELPDSDALKSIMADAIVRAVDEKTRDALLAPGEPAYHGGQRRASPLEEAYKWAVERHAQKAAHEILEQDEAVKTKVRDLLREAMDRAFVKHREATVERVATAIAEGMWKRDDR